MSRRSTRKSVVAQEQASTEDDEDVEMPEIVPGRSSLRSKGHATAQSSLSPSTSPTPPSIRVSRGWVPGKGKPPKGGRPLRVRQNPNSSQFTVGLLSFPVTAEDEEVVQCMKCSEQMSSSAFRLHNMTMHYNLAKTSNDPTVEDRKFYDKRLRDLAKLKGITMFSCPHCEGRYKSALGLAIHLESCGRSGEELMSFPVTVTEPGDKIVECSMCSQKMASSNFRRHNVKLHYNLAKTTSDRTVEDRKYYERKLRELAKLKNVSVFSCPRCSTKYKSTLGLAYHLEACGKSEAEVDSLKITCEVCQERLLAPNMAHHRKTHHRERPAPRSEMRELVCRAVDGSQRKSAIKARLVLHDGSGEDDNDSRVRVRVKTEEEDEDWSLQEDEMYDDDDFERRKRKSGKNPSLLKPGASAQREPPAISYSRDGIISLDSIPLVVTAQAEKEQRKSGSTDAWDSKTRNYVDPLERFGLLEKNQENKLQKLKSKADVLLHLPPKEKSLRFCTRTLVDEETSECHSTNFRRLNRFDSHIVDEYDFNCVSFAGGAIKAVAWHPSAKILAISTFKNEDEDPNVRQALTRESSVLIFCQINEGRDSPETSFSLELVVCLNYGYINDLKWCNFWPVRADVLLDKTRAKNQSDPIKKIGYLACAMEDSTVRILSLNADDFELPYTYPPTRSKHRIYKKAPEVVLAIDPASSPSPGHCLCFDWHEDQKYLIAGYGSGLIAVYDLATKSSLLRSQTQNAEKLIEITIHPIWLINGHTLPVRSVLTDPKNCRYFCTGSMDRYLKTWDLELREEIESKFVGSIMDMCWIRGYMHMAVSCDSGLNYGSPNTQSIFVRVYGIGNSKGISNYAEASNITSVDFFEGMLAQGTEFGRVTVTYYDAYWRDADYERNKKKKNYTVICNINVEEESVEPLPTLSRNETRETVTAAAEEYQEHFQPKDSRFILSFSKDRVHRSDVLQTSIDPTPSQIETMVRCHNLLKVNKVAWSPDGKFVAVGYRNGLLVISPASFDRLFTRNIVSRGRRQKIVGYATNQPSDTADEEIIIA